MAPGSISYHICFQSTFICIFIFYIYIIKYQKYIYLIILSLSDLTFASGREGIWQPLYRVGCEFFVCLCRFVGHVEKPPTGLIPWFSITEGNTYATLLHHPFLFKGKPTQCSRGSIYRLLEQEFVLKDSSSSSKMPAMSWACVGFPWRGKGDAAIVP